MMKQRKVRIESIALRRIMRAAQRGEARMVGGAEQRRYDDRRRLYIST
jgi:hypothetical protein